jgi:hypothetical protein
MKPRALHLASSAALASALVVFGCSSSTDTTSAPATPAADASTDPAPSPAEADAGDDAASKCAPPPSKSNCESQGAWVRGIAHFDPSKVKAGSKPVLRVTLRHSFIMVKGEEAIGGRLHGWSSVPIADPAKGEVPFAIDMCDLGTSMWSEENGVFHVVLIVDENGDNDLDNATSNEDAIAMGIPSMGELVKMVDVDVSCHALSPCVDVKLDCTGGAACTTFEPIKSCKKKTPGCESDSVFCR